VAKTLLSSATAEIEPLREEVLGRGLTIVGVMSAKQESIGLAVQQKFPTVPHQICQYHDLKDVAQPVCEADRHVKKEIKQKVRGVRDVERQAEPSLTKAAQVVADSC
jgi:2-phosphoglycerate kinase